MEKVQIHISDVSQGEVFPVHAMKAYWGSIGIAPLILNFGLRWRWLSSLPGRFIPGKEHWYPFYRRLSGTQSRSGLFLLIKCDFINKMRLNIFFVSHYFRFA
jgi:hypothetical protein